MRALAKLYVHLVTSTKNRRPSLNAENRPRLFEYLGGVTRELECPSIVWGGVGDHVHGLFCLSKNTALVDVVQHLKQSSSKWIKSLDGQDDTFAWQSGYAAFSVSMSLVPTVERYIRLQEQRHAKMSFKDELRELFRRHGVTYDERYVWD